MSIVDNVTPTQQSRALWLSTVAFTTCFAVWTIFSIIGLQIQKDLGLSETEFGLLVGTPILSGSLIGLNIGDLERPIRRPYHLYHRYGDSSHSDIFADYG